MTARSKTESTALLISSDIGNSKSAAASALSNPKAAKSAKNSVKSTFAAMYMRAYAEERAGKRYSPTCFFSRVAFSVSFCA